MLVLLTNALTWYGVSASRSHASEALYTELAIDTLRGDVCPFSELRGWAIEHFKRTSPTPLSKEAAEGLDGKFYFPARQQPAPLPAGREARSTVSSTSPR